jgi:two-component system, cell cycle sensor histidine kinase and response regulator CckA
MRAQLRSNAGAVIRNPVAITLSLAFAFLIAILMGIGWLGLSRMGRVNNDLNEIFEKHWAKVHMTRDIVRYSSRNNQLTLQVFLQTRKEDAEVYFARRSENVAAITRLLKEIEARVDSDEERQRLAVVLAARDQFSASYRRAINLVMEKNDFVAARKEMTNVTVPLQMQYHDIIEGFVQYEIDQMNKARAEKQANYAAARRLVIWLILAGIVIAVSIAIFVTRKTAHDDEQRELAKEEFRKLNEGLEEKVQERTQKLEQEIRERKQYEADLRWMAVVVDASRDAILSETVDGTILSWNPGAERLFGYSAAEAIGQSVAMLSPPACRGGMQALLDKVKGGDNAEQFETTRLKKDGTPVHLALTLSPIRDDKGAVVGISAIARDVGERKKMEEDLRAASQRTIHLLDSITDAFFGTDEKFRFIYVNQQATKLLRRPREKLLGSTIWEVFSEFAGTPFETETRRAMEQRTAVHFEEFYAPLGMWLDVRQYPSIEGLSLLVRDVTEKRAFESQLRQGQKMEAIGQLSGGVAHDFNNLLGVIIGHTDLMEGRTSQDSPLRNSMNEIKKASQSAASLTRQLLAFSRQQVLAPRVLDLNAVILNVEKMLRRLIGEHVELKTALDPALGHIKADQGQIEQVIINLAVNARDAMPQGGTIRIETSNVNGNGIPADQHSTQPTGPCVLLKVTDTGSGMSAETQAHIFEPFFTTKELGKGTGLGLATVYGIVKQSDGYIWVDSEVGKGSTFWIYLPVCEETAQAEKATAGKTESLPGKETVLLVEDEEGLRELTRTLLAESGYKVLEAERPERALEIAREYRGPIHLLLTDVVMPGMNGPALARKLVQTRREMKVLFVSGYANFSQPEMLDSEAVLLPKPFTQASLLKKLREVLDAQLSPTSS